MVNVPVDDVHRDFKSRRQAHRSGTVEMGWFLPDELYINLIWFGMMWRNELK